MPVYSEPPHITVFKRWYKQLINSINVKDVTASLMSASYMTLRDLQSINIKCDNEGQIAASEILMTNVLLRNPDPDCFKYFTEALESSNHAYLARLLRLEYNQYTEHEANRAALERAAIQADRDSRERQRTFGQPRYSVGESLPEYTDYQPAAEVGSDVQPAGSRSIEPRPSYVADNRTHQMEVTGEPAQDATGLGSGNTSNNEYGNEQVALAAGVKKTKIARELMLQREQRQQEFQHAPDEALFTDVATGLFVPIVDIPDLNLDYHNRLGKGVVVGSFNGTSVAVKEVPLNVNKRNKNKGWKELCKDQVNREFQVSIYIRHANVALLMAYALEKQSLYLVYELIHGHNMEQVIFHDDISCLYCLDKKEKFFLTIQVVQALAFLHQCNPKVIHGDIRPAKMVVNRSKNTVKLCDLGLTKLKERNAVTSTGGNLTPGTPMYMAREQLLDSKPSTTRTDVWSMGASMYEIFFEQQVWIVSEADILKGIKIELVAHRKPALLEKPDEKYRDVADLIGKCMQTLDTNRPPALNVLKDLQFAEKKYHDALETSNGD